METIAIHLGLHKTASTYLQGTLDSEENKPVLEKNGIRMLAPATLRDAKFTRIFGNIIKGRQEGVEDDSQRVSQLRKIANNFIESSNGQRVIFTEENLSGFCTEPLSKGGIYPQFENRMALINEVFKGYKVEIHICLRSFATYLPSAYCEALRGTRKSFPFRRYIRDLSVNDLTWVPILKILGKAFPENKIVIWEYEKLREEGYHDKVINSLAGKDISDQISPRKSDARRSIPNGGIQLIRAADSLLSKSEVSNLITLLDSSKMEWESKEAFQPWTKLELDLIAENRVKDMDFIRAESQFDLI